MYDTKAKSSPRGYDDHFDRAEPEEPSIRPSEADLLRALGRALAEQRAHERIRANQFMPLVDRIETILGSRLQAANDIGSAADPDWIEEPLQWQEPDVKQVDRPVTVDLLDDDVQLHSGVGRTWLKSVTVVAAAASIGLALPLLLPSSPTRYAATTLLSAKTEGAGRAAAMQALSGRLVSTPFIASMVAKLKLDHDAEFAGSKASSVSVALDLLTASGAAADPASRAETSLKNAITITEDAVAGTLALRVTATDAAKSTRIANYLAGAVAGDAAPKARPGDDTLRKAYEDAQAELTTFTQKSGDGNVKVAVDLQRQIDQLDADLKIADQRILLAKDGADRLKAAKLADLSNGVLPPELLSQALQDWRDKYAAAKVSLAQLSANLGPRHPRLLQLQAEADGLKDNISRELLRLAQDADAAVKSAASARKGLNDRRNTLIAQSRDTGVDLARLTELREKASLARSRLDEAGASTDATTDVTVSVAKPAQITEVAAGSSVFWRALLGGGLGLLFGLTALLMRRLFRQSSSLPDVETPMQPPIPVEMHSAPEPAPQPAPEPDSEMEELRLKIAGLRDRLRHYAAERPAAFR